MNANTFHLWCAFPADLLKEEAAAACAALLNGEETARWQRFRFDRHRRAFLATHALVRSALSCYRPTRAADWQFVAGEHGKPALTPGCGLRFNLSNALDLVVCLVAERAEVGIDTEPHSRAEEILALAADVFSAQERDQLNALPAGAQPARALSLWTLKEAYVKARGLGLSLPLADFSFLFDPGGDIRLVLTPALHDAAQNWRFTLLDHAGHRIALVVEAAAAGAIELLEARPPFAAPTKIDLPLIEWFPRA